MYACAPSLDPETFQVSRDQDGGIRWDVYAPVGTDIEANDRVEFNGQLLDVDGPPTPWFAISDSKPVGQVHNLIWKEAIDG